MAIIKRLKDNLDEAKIPYDVYNHALAYTAQEIAAKQHVSGNELAKVVMLETDDELVMGVIRGNDKIDLPTVEDSLGVHRVRLATEAEFIARFPECEIGAMPPFGNLFGVKVFVDPALEKDEYIFFNAGITCRRCGSDTKISRDWRSQRWSDWPASGANSGRS
jgi:Ala-tRNA(Pro) deacylase